MKAFTTKQHKRVKLPEEVIRRYGAPKPHGKAGKRRAICKWRSRKGKRRADRIALQKEN